MVLRATALAAALLLLAQVALAEGLREIAVPVVLGGGDRTVYSEHGEPNGMPCEWYAYAVQVGLAPCVHPGMDIEANFEPLYAATDGVVEFAGSDGYYKPLHVDIRVTDGTYDAELHIYGHMSEILVKTGDRVKRGQRIGTSGTAGSGAHLHFERRSEPTDQYPGGRALDPEPVLTDDLNEGT